MLGLRAEYVPLGFQIGQVCRLDNFHEVLGTFDVLHRGMGHVGGYRLPQGVDALRVTGRRALRSKTD